MSLSEAKEQFHIAEWYGKPFLDLTNEERAKLADYKAGRSMPKNEIARLEALADKKQSTKLTIAEQKRFDELEAKLEKQKSSLIICPFRTDMKNPVCSKKGGVCSLRLYEGAGTKIKEVGGPRGGIRALCPYRFHENDIVFKSIGEEILGDECPAQIGEVGFLKSTGNLDSNKGEDVGRIDMVLAKTNAPEGYPAQWCAVEIQAVYFSGREMGIEFQALKENGGNAGMPVEGRRPDYRSSGPKRLMPQLQIKVPTLRRWGKKMVVVVDKSFFESLGEMERVEEQSNCDVIWYLVDFVRLDNMESFKLVVVDRIFTTLERAIEGLTGGDPVALEEFEQQILKKSN